MYGELTLLTPGGPHDNSISRTSEEVVRCYIHCGSQTLKGYGYIVIISLPSTVAYRVATHCSIVKAFPSEVSSVRVLGMSLLIP